MVSRDRPVMFMPISPKPRDSVVRAVITMEDIDENPWHEQFNAKPIKLAKQRPSHNEEFKMRPIRLGSKQHDEELVASDEVLISPSSSPKRSSSDIINPTTPRRRSIQIKNLPIIEKSPSRLRTGPQPKDFIFAICLVDFHHIRGPEIQWWRSNYIPEYLSELFKNLPFQSLPDGSHLFEETFSNFNLIYDFSTNKSFDNLQDLSTFSDDPRNLKTLFGCSCIRQINISDLSEEELKRNKDIKRSIVQKALVIINNHKPIFTKIKDKLSIITKSYFLQDNLAKFDVFDNLFENLNYEINFNDNEEFFINLNLKQTLIQLGPKFLMIFKALLLEKKVLIYSNNKLELLTKFQNNLISLIPNLINNLVYSGCQLSDYQENSNGKLNKPTSLNTENRDSMLNFFGLPLKIFDTKGSFWNPYLPLQQINQLDFPETKSFMIGCSNLLFVKQLKDLGVDIVVNLDSYDVTYPNGSISEISLSTYDKNFISNLISNCSNEQILKSENFVGNDDYIRYQFEDYLLSLLSTVRFTQYVNKFHQYPPGFSGDGNSNNEDDNAFNGDYNCFNASFVNKWLTTKNFEIWDMTCDEFVFNFVKPRHVQVDLVNQLTFTSFFNNYLRIKTSDDSDNEVKPNKYINHRERRNGNRSTNANDKETKDKTWNFFNRN